MALKSRHLRLMLNQGTDAAGPRPTADQGPAGRAHEVLQNDVDAVVRVQAVQFGEVAVRVARAEVVLPVHVAAHSVEAVDLVQHGQLSDVRVRAVAPVFGEFGRRRGV